MSAAGVTLGLLVRLGVCATTIGAAAATTTLTLASRLLVRVCRPMSRSGEQKEIVGRDCRVDSGRA
jgi:hypothetical protein